MTPSGDGGLQARIAARRGQFELRVAVEVRAGEVLAVIGPNGAGKTTLLRVLAGLTAPDEGRVSVAGEVWNDVPAGVFVPATGRAVGLVFQDYRLFPHLSVLDNVAFAPRSHGAGRKESRVQAGEVIGRLGLSELSERRPAQLSGGQAQRVALARALAARPRMLLLDEPLAALDARAKLEIRTELRRRLADFDGPIVVVTHDPLEALVLADRILVLEAGRVVQEGTPSEVSRRPATQYVARLMGLNLYPGVIRERSPGEQVVALDGGGVLVSTSSGPDGPDGSGGSGGSLRPDGSDSRAGEPGEAADLEEQRVLAVLAPSAVTLHRERPEGISARNVWAGRVAGVELLTDRVRVAVEGEPDVLADLTPSAVADLGLSAGQPVWLTAKASEVVSYPDPATTRRPADPVTGRTGG